MHVFAYSTYLLFSTPLTMASWSPVSHSGLVSMALFSAGSSHICHLVASVSNVKVTCLPGTHPPVVSPRFCPWSITLRHVHHSSQYPHFLLFPKPAPLCRRHSALPFLPSDSLRLQHRTLSECSKSNFLLDDCKSSDTELLSDWTPLTMLETSASYSMKPHLFWPDLTCLQILLLPYSSASLYPSIPRYQNSFHHCHFHCSLQAWPLQLSLSQPAQVSAHLAPIDSEFSCTCCCQSY